MRRAAHTPVEINVLILEDKPHDADLMVDALRRAGFDASGTARPRPPSSRTNAVRPKVH